MEWFDGHLDLDPMIIDKPIDRISFLASVDQAQVPGPAAGDVVVMDNLASPKQPGARAAIEAAEVEWLDPPRHSPDFHPSENAFSKLKAPLRKATQNSVEGLWSTIGNLLDAFTPRAHANIAASAGYAAVRSENALMVPGFSLFPAISQ